MVVLKMIYKAEGYQAYSKLARITHDFVTEFLRQKNIILYGEKKKHDPLTVEKVTERLVIRDIRLAIRFSILLRD